MTNATPHQSDCAVHNAPYKPAGPCDCGATNATPSPETLREWAYQLEMYPDGSLYQQIDYLLSEAERLEQPVDDTELRAALAQSEARAERLEKALREIVQESAFLSPAVQTEIERTAIRALAADPPKPEKEAG